MNDVIQRSFPPLLHNAGDPIPYALIPINKERLTLFVDVTLMGVTQTTVREKKKKFPRSSFFIAHVPTFACTKRKCVNMIHRNNLFFFLVILPDASLD